MKLVCGTVNSSNESVSTRPIDNVRKDVYREMFQGLENYSNEHRSDTAYSITVVQDQVRGFLVH